MTKRLALAFAAAICFLGVVLLGLWTPSRSGAEIGLKFVGLTNNSAGLLGTSDKVLAVFLVTNRAASPMQDAGFYYIETAGAWETYSPLGSGGQIGPHGSGTILTRVPTNRAPWRVIVPYSGTRAVSQIVCGVRDAVDRVLRRPSFAFDRYGKGAPTSDWVKP